MSSQPSRPASLPPPSERVQALVSFLEHESHPMIVFDRT
jgi:hypothetical protein